MNYVCQTTRQIQQKISKTGLCVKYIYCIYKKAPKQNLNLGVSMSCKCLEIECVFALRWVFIVFKCVVVSVVAVMTGWERTVWTVAYWSWQWSCSTDGQVLTGLLWFLQIYFHMQAQTFCSNVYHRLSKGRVSFLKVPVICVHLQN